MKYLKIVVLAILFSNQILSQSLIINGIEIGKVTSEMYHEAEIHIPLHPIDFHSITTDKPNYKFSFKNADDFWSSFKLYVDGVSWELNIEEKRNLRIYNKRISGFSPTKIFSSKEIKPLPIENPIALTTENVERIVESADTSSNSIIYAAVKDLSVNHEYDQPVEELPAVLNKEVVQDALVKEVNITPSTKLEATDVSQEKLSYQHGLILKGEGWISLDDFKLLLKEAEITTYNVRRAQRQMWAAKSEENTVLKNTGLLITAVVILPPSLLITAVGFGIGDPVVGLIGLTGTVLGVNAASQLTTQRGFERKAEKNIIKAVDKYNEKLTAY
jgi:hypothetical protein